MNASLKTPLALAAALAASLALPATAQAEAGDWFVRGGVVSVQPESGNGRLAGGALFADIDVILTAPAPGEAPPSLATTGKATFNLLWTYLWMPCITLPFTTGPTGLPVAIQLVGRQHEDTALLDVAAWARSVL